MDLKKLEDGLEEDRKMVLKRALKMYRLGNKTSKHNLTLQSSQSTFNLLPSSPSSLTGHACMCLGFILIKKKGWVFSFCSSCFLECVTSLWARVSVSAGLSVGRSVRHNFLKGREVTLQRSYGSTYFRSSPSFSSYCRRLMTGLPDMFPKVKDVQ